MIAKVLQKTQYGKQGTTGINVLHELDSKPVECFAHSVQDAKKWALEFPAFQGADVEELRDGNVVIITGQWNSYDPMNEIFAEDQYSCAQFTRLHIMISPVNTIYENVGFQAFRDER